MKKTLVPTAVEIDSTNNVSNTSPSTVTTYHTGSISQSSLPIVKQGNLADIITQYSFVNGFDWYSTSPTNAHKQQRQDILDAIIQAIISHLHTFHVHRPSFIESISKFIRMYYSNELIDLAGFPDTDQQEIANLYTELKQRVNEQFNICYLQKPDDVSLPQYLSPLCQQVELMDGYYQVSINDNVKLLTKPDDQRVHIVRVNWNEGTPSAKKAGQDCIRWYFATHQLEDILQNYQMGFGITVTSESTHFQNAAKTEAMNIINRYRQSSSPRVKNLFKRYERPDDTQYDQLCTIQYPMTQQSYFQPEIPISTTQAPSAPSVTLMNNGKH